MDRKRARRTARSATSLGLALVLALAGCEKADPAEKPPQEPTFDYPLDDTLRLHHVQTKGTHNSYHVESEGNELLDWNYTHVPLDEQALEQGVRHFELDIQLDHDTGELIVVHIPIFDEGTTCASFVACLQTLRGFSDAHRAHHAIVVQIEIKDPIIADHEAYFAILHEEIASVWPAERVVLPADVQGTHASVGDAVRDVGWPTLGEVRGKVVFALDDGGDLQRAYTYDRTSLDGRVLFPSSSPGDAFAAFTVLNDPIGGAEAIAAALAANMLVRTRADSGVVEASENDTARRQTAFDSGAHFITTDFPAKVEEYDYFVEIPEGSPSRCNPITAPTDCSARDIEDPSQL